MLSLLEHQAFDAKVLKFLDLTLTSEDQLLGVVVPQMLSKLPAAYRKLIGTESACHFLSPSPILCNTGCDLISGFLPSLNIC